MAFSHYFISFFFWNSCCCAQLCPIPCGHMDCSPPDPPVHGIFQARIRSGLLFLTLRDLPDPGIEPMFLVSPALAGRILTAYATWEAPLEVIAKLKTSSTSLIFPLTFYYNWNLFPLSTSFSPGVFISGGCFPSYTLSIHGWRYSVCSSCSSLMFTNHFSILPELHIIRV